MRIIKNVIYVVSTSLSNLDCIVKLLSGGSTAHLKIFQFYLTKKEAK